MIPVVNNKYKYILLYSAKAGCTSLRALYLLIHGHELSVTQKEQLDWYHNLNEVEPIDPSMDYSEYYTFTITRNPYSRIVSAYLDQFAFAKNAGVQAMLEAHPPERIPDTFIEFLEYLRLVPDCDRDTHFQTQAYFPYAEQIVTNASRKYRWLRKKPDYAFGVRYNGDIAGFDHHMSRVYTKIFSSNSKMMRHAKAQISEIKKKNSSFYGGLDFDDAAQLTVAELDALTFAPKPQDFYASQQVKSLVEEIYAHDFLMFSYPKGDIPQKQSSKELELMPNDFDWEMYIRLNPDLPRDEIYNKRSVVRHYLEFGRFEEHPRAYKIEAPNGFDWVRYLDLNEDLRDSGINTEQQAIEHFISYGIREDRKT